MVEFFSVGGQNLNLFQVCGIVGFLIYVVSFAAQQMGYLCGNGYLYPAYKVVAASMVLISLSDAFNLASALIQSSYILIGFFGLFVRLGRAHKNRPVGPIDPQSIRA